MLNICIELMTVQGLEFELHSAEGAAQNVLRSTKLIVPYIVSSRLSWIAGTWVRSIMLTI